MHRTLFLAYQKAESMHKLLIYDMVGNEGFGRSSGRDPPLFIWKVTSVTFHHSLCSWAFRFEFLYAIDKIKTHPKNSRWVLMFIWLGMRDSNPRCRIQSPEPYHLANSQYKRVCVWRNLLGSGFLGIGATSLGEFPVCEWDCIERSVFCKFIFILDGAPWCWYRELFDEWLASIVHGYYLVQKFSENN